MLTGTGRLIAGHLLPVGTGATLPAKLRSWIVAFPGGNYVSSTAWSGALRP